MNYHQYHGITHYKYPVIIKRSLGVSLDDALQTAEYVAASGNTKIIFCLRGVKSIYTKEHQHLTDFAQIPVIKRLGKLPIAIYPSESIGNRNKDCHGILDIQHVAAQGVVAGANLLFIDFNPNESQTTINAKQAVNAKELEFMLADLKLARKYYYERSQLVKQTETVIE